MGRQRTAFWLVSQTLALVFLLVYPFLPRIHGVVLLMAVNTAVLTTFYFTRSLNSQLIRRLLAIGAGACAGAISAIESPWLIAQASTIAILDSVLIILILIWQSRVEVQSWKRLLQKLCLTVLLGLVVSNCLFGIAAWSSEDSAFAFWKQATLIGTVVGILLALLMAPSDRAKSVSA